MGKLQPTTRRYIALRNAPYVMTRGSKANGRFSISYTAGSKDVRLFVCGSVESCDDMLCLERILLYV